jgi:hypothetical protein
LRSRHVYVLAAIVAAGMLSACKSSKSTSSAERSPSPDQGRGRAPAILQIAREEVDKTFAIVRESGQEVFRWQLSDSEICNVKQEQAKLDFDGNGQDEFVVYVHEGQNSGDRGVVIGQREGRWSVWFEFYRPHWWQDYPTNQGTGRPTIVVADINAPSQTLTYEYRHGAFWEQRSFSVAPAPDHIAAFENAVLQEGHQPWRLDPLLVAQAELAAIVARHYEGLTDDALSDRITDASAWTLSPANSPGHSTATRQTATMTATISLQNSNPPSNGIWYANRVMITERK